MAKRYRISRVYCARVYWEVTADSPDEAASWLQDDYIWARRKRIEPVAKELKDLTESERLDRIEEIPVNGVHGDTEREVPYRSKL